MALFVQVGWCVCDAVSLRFLSYVIRCVGENSELEHLNAMK